MNQSQATSEPYDVIIVGAGAAGCVLAARLSETGNKRVLLIEAGPDAPPGKEHADIRDSFPVSSGNARFFWTGLTAEVSAEPGNAIPRVSVPYLQGFGLGGGSNVNGMLADRGYASDYDEWQDLGASGWAWRDVLPYFKKLEHDQDFVGPLHGSDGPIPIRRVHPELWAPLARALADVLVRRGAAVVADSNGDVHQGVSSVPMNCLPDQRISASMAYLTEEVRRRPNLTILADTRVTRITIRGERVQGIQLHSSDKPQLIYGMEVIVACGAVHSPILLLRSGIGSASHLRALRIDVIRDLPGVGRNLQNHPIITLSMHLRRRAMQSARDRPWQQNQFHYSSNVAGCSEHDMLLLPANKTGWHPLGRRVGAVSVLVLKAYSKGWVELVRTDRGVIPRVRFNLLDDPRDFDRVVHGLRLMFELLAEDEVSCMRNEVFTPDDAVAGRLENRSLLRWIEAWLISMALSIGPLRRRLLKKHVLDVHAMIKDEQALRSYVQARSRAVYHACGTCKMESPHDPDAVVDSHCRVLGVSGLRVVDASIFPTIPSAGTHLSVLMAAEKIADQIKRDWREEECSSRALSA